MRTLSPVKSSDFQSCEDEDFESSKGEDYVLSKGEDFESYETSQRVVVPKGSIL